MGIERINVTTEEISISEAVKVGNLVFTAGAAMGEPGEDIETQTAKTIDYLGEVLKKAGSDLQHVVKAGVFLADIGEWGRFNAVWKRYFPTDKPARTTTQVGKFAEGVKIEIDFVAVVPEGR